MLREINGILRQTNLPNESEEYLLKRDELAPRRNRFAEPARTRRGAAPPAPPGSGGRGLRNRGSVRETRCRRHTDPEDTAQRAFHEPESVCGHLSLHVRQKTNEGLSDVHGVD